MRAKQAGDLPDRRKVCIGGASVTLLAGGTALWPHRLIGQTAGQPDNPVRVGDHWTYATNDEITGLATESYTHAVTEISANRIVIGASAPGRSASRLIVFDRDWNRLEGRGLRFTPHNGLGFPTPLVVGKEWRTVCEMRNTDTGAAWKESVSSKCVAQEAVTTPAGTFDTFKVETRSHDISASDPAKFWDYEYARWYAPEINRWIRWNSTGKNHNRLQSKRSEELIEFGRAG
jgi:hypothetical protein